MYLLTPYSALPLHKAIPLCFESHPPSPTHRSLFSSSNSQRAEREEGISLHSITNTTTPEGGGGGAPTIEEDTTMHITTVFTPQQHT